MPNCSKLPLNFNAERLKADLDQILPDDWAPHFNDRYYEGDWSGVALRSISGLTSQLYADPATAKPFANTPALARCQYFQQALAEFKCPLNSARLLRLGPGSRIREHTDYNLSLDDGEIGIHIPIITNPLVRFYLNGERILMEEGECWYLNLNLPHRVENPGTTDRIHLVIHCAVNDWARDMINRCGEYQAAPQSMNPDAALAEMSPRESLNRFRHLVLQDLELQERLRKNARKELFIARMVEMGKERGFDFSAGDVEVELMTSRRAWLERWT
jgi:aspartyl/asparaginyl beta-hydroxylase